MERQEELLFSNQQLVKLIWPLFVEQLLSVLVGMVDVMMVAYIGEQAVSGVSLVDSLNHLVIMALFALTSGGTVISARAVGARDGQRTSRCTAQIMGSSVAVMILVGMILLLGGRGLLKVAFSGAEDAVISDAARYMVYTALSFPFLAIYQSSSAVMRAKGNTRLSMRVSLGMNILNIIGNAVCIFLLGMGVEGVAIPTLISRVAAALAMIFFLQREDDIAVRDISQFRPDGEILKGILSIGVPNSVESVLFNFGKVLLQSLVATLGTPALAAYAVAGNLATYLYLPGNALSTAITTLTGQCWGAGKKDQAKYYTRKMVAVDYITLIPICAVLIIFRDLWVSLYSLTGQAASYAADLILSHCVAMIVWPLAFQLPYYFRAIGRAMFTMIVSLTAMGVFRVGLAYLFVKVMGRDVLWVWYAMYADWIFRLVIFTREFFFKTDGTAENGR